MSRGAMVLVLVLTAAERLADAHQSSTSHSTIRIEGDGRIDYTLALSTRDLYEALALEKDRDATDDEVHAGEERLWSYVERKLSLAGEHGQPCAIERTGYRLREDAERRVELRFVARCPTPGTVTIDYGLFFDLDPRHTGWASISQGATTTQEEFKAGAGRRVLDVRGGLGAFDYILEGVEHIFTGYDHLCFLLGLLLVAVLTPTLRGSLRAVAATVTAFTAAHSLTLILAALGVVTLPSRVVESAIAASIVFVAVENLLRRAPSKRWPLVFAFGLVHGLGFASLLAPLLPPRGVIAPLLLFNLGVELGQLAIVLAVVPLLYGLARRDADRYRRTVLVGGSIAIGLLGLVWLIERVGDVKLTSQWL